MKLALCWLALVALPAPGQVREGHVAPVAVYTQFQQQPPQPVLDALKDELASIMAPMGLDFEWRSLADVTGQEVSVELAVVTFKGRCDLADLSPHSGQPTILGWTHISDGVILPFTDVDCDRIRGFLQARLSSMEPNRRAASFGRAIGRVLAHELYHIFAHTTRHGSGGVGRAFYSVEELTAAEFRFEETELRMLSNSKARMAVENDKVAAVHGATPQAGLSLFKSAGCSDCHGARGDGTARGPALHGSGKSLSTKTLAAKLRKSIPKMHRSARDVRVSQPSLSEADMEILAGFLNTLVQKNHGD